MHRFAAPAAASIAGLALAFAVGACDERPEKKEAALPASTLARTRLATFGGGCFWCVDALFTRLEGVEAVESGYAGGDAPNPSYEQVCGGGTGHAEVVQVRYDPAKVKYEALLEVFWKTHDPTTPNRQGADFGTQYRSIILFHDDEQRRTAESLKADLEKAGAFSGPIVTEIVPYDRFWKAEAYHQGYYADNASKPYCKAVIAPKIEKLEKVFRDRLKRP